MVAAIVVQLEGQDGRPGSDQGVPPTPGRFRKPSGGSVQQPARGGSDYTAADCMGWTREAGFRETRAEPLVAHDHMVVGVTYLVPLLR